MVEAATQGSALPSVVFGQVRELPDDRAVCLRRASSPLDEHSRGGMQHRVVGKLDDRFRCLVGGEFFGLGEERLRPGETARRFRIHAAIPSS